MSDFIFESSTSLNSLFRFNATLTNKDTHSIDTEVANTIQSSALMTTFFRKEDLKELLAQTDCQGIRFYPANDSKGQPSLLAVGISRGQDLVKAFFPSKRIEKCFVSQGRAAAINVPTETGAIELEAFNKRINEADANGEDREEIFPFINPVKSVQRNIAKVVFNKSTLQRLYRNPIGETVLGVEFYTTKIQFSGGKDAYKTLAARPIIEKDKIERSGDMVLSALPCPPHCGMGGYTGRGNL